MFVFRNGGRQAVQAIRAPTPSVQTRFASKITIPFPPPPVPVIETCPPPTCKCRESPPGLDIERHTNINGSMASYAEQVLICTGRDDWKSRIEDEEDATLVRQLKRHLTRGGKYADPFHHVLLTNVSFPPSSSSQRPLPATDPDISRSDSSAANASPPTPASASASASAYLVPSFTYVPKIPTADSHSIETLVKAFILPQKPHPGAPDRLPPGQRDPLLRDTSLQSHFPGTRPVHEMLILICGHGGRDGRCGQLGPILRDEFEEKLEARGVRVLPKGAEEGGEGGEGGRGGEGMATARVGLISHIGGHKWAGNVIIYIPSSWERNGLKGKGIWYGRVKAEHVEGIVDETVMEGRVIRDLFRGGVDRDGAIVRL